MRFFVAFAHNLYAVKTIDHTASENCDVIISVAPSLKKKVKVTKVSRRFICFPTNDK